jgi:serine/threonine-protein kinase
MVFPEILGPLPGGGMAELWRARLANGTVVAVKRLRPELRGHAEMRAMFADEGRLCALLDHPHVVRLLEQGEDEEGPYLAFELVDGADLREVLGARAGPLPGAVVHVLARALLGALSHAHGLRDSAGKSLDVVHRDISPSNVLLARHGEVKLADFGVAASVVKTHQTRAGDLKGKCAYMSPEQTQGLRVDRRSDLFSLGVVLWECAAGRPLFDRPTDVDTMLAVREAAVESLAGLAPGLPAPLCHLVHALLARVAWERPDSAVRALVDLDASLPPPGEDGARAAVREVVEAHRTASPALPGRGSVPRRRTAVGRPDTAGAAAGGSSPGTARGGTPRRGAAAWAAAGALIVVGAFLWPWWAWWPAGVPAGSGTAQPGAQDHSAASSRESDDVTAPGVPGPGTSRTPLASRDAASRVTGRGSSSAGVVARSPGALGTLDLNSEPWAEVSLDGTPLGVTTPARGVRVPAGRRRLTFRNPVFRLEKTVEVEVPEGGRSAVVVDLER